MKLRTGGKFSLPNSLALIMALALAAGGNGMAEDEDADADSKKEEGRDWVYLENDYLEVGLTRALGGGIGLLQMAGSERNLLNHHDHGRLVQQSYYGDADGSMWGEREWTYNPVQGGSYKGQPAVVEALEASPIKAYVRTIPRNWAGGELLEECRMEQVLELDGPLLRLSFTFSYNGDKRHAPRHQETPAVFLNKQLDTLARYQGAAPWTGGALTRHQPGWPNESIAMDEHWAAWVDDENQGLGIYVPGVEQATCYTYEAPGEAGCTYVAPLGNFALEPGLRFYYRAVLTAGSLEEIRGRFEALHAAETRPPDRLIQYKKAGERPLLLHVFLPDGHRNSDPRPGILFFHGGGWKGGDPSQFYPHCRLLARRGMVAVTADYRLQNVDGTTPLESLADARSALRTLRSMAGELGIDPERIACGGGSAGGHLAAACAFVDGFDDPADDLSIPLEPDALVLFNPVVDNGPEGYGQERLGEQWQAFSPMHNVDAPAPPTLFLLGDQDNLIPVETAERFRNRIEQAGGQCKVVIYPDQPHGFFNHRGGKNPAYYETVAAMEEFLESLEYLKE